MSVEGPGFIDLDTKSDTPLSPFAFFFIKTSILRGKFDGATAFVLIFTMDLIYWWECPTSVRRVSVERPSN